MIMTVLGLGSIGVRHARNLMSLGIDVQGFDPDAARRALLQDAGGAPFSTREEALNGAEAVLICSPSQYHLDDLQNAVDLGLHAFIEKPLAHTTFGLSDIFSQAEDKGLILFHGFFLRYHPCLEAAKKLIDEGRLGSPLWARALCSGYLPSWRPHQDYTQGYAANSTSGGALLDNIHEFDLIFSLLGPAKLIGAFAHQSGTLDISSEDIADVILAHDNGARSTVHVDYVTQPAKRTAEISGTLGRIEINLITRQLVYLDVDGISVIKETFGGSFGDDYISEMRAFIACIAGQEQPRCSNEDAVHTLTQVLMARKQSGLPAHD